MHFDDSKHTNVRYTVIRINRRWSWCWKWKPHSPLTWNGTRPHKKWPLVDNVAPDQPLHLRCLIRGIHTCEPESRWHISGQCSSYIIIYNWSGWSGALPSAHIRRPYFAWRNAYKSCSFSLTWFVQDTSYLAHSLNTHALCLYVLWLDLLKYLWFSFQSHIHLQGHMSTSSFY